MSLLYFNGFYKWLVVIIQLICNHCTRPLGVRTEQCTTLQQYSNSYPLGKAQVEGIHLLARNISLNECLSLCCEEGPTVCHYVWLFEGRCIGLPCLTNKTACSPQIMGGLPSTLVSVKYNNNTERGNQTTAGLSSYNMVWYSYSVSCCYCRV